MSIKIVVPTLGESVTEATVAQWLKQVGEPVALDEPIVELETDKVTLEINAAEAGVLSEITVEEGVNVEVGALLGTIGDAGSAVKAAPAPVVKPVANEDKPAVVPVAQQAPAKSAPTAVGDFPLSPAVRKLVEDNSLDASKITGTGKEGRILKGDVLAFLESGQQTAIPTAAVNQGPREERVRMTRLRQRISQRLKEAQNTAALLTTFNEIDMGNCMALRKEYKESFEKRHGTKLGFMSFFVKAAIQALKDFPAVNAEISGDELIYKNYYDIGVAVSTPTGLVVPVLRDADQKNFAEIESKIVDLGTRARDGELGLDELTGGTFTITNGGVFGSLMSTPIINPPQSAILGMHKIQERPMAVNGEVKIRPMMYIALTYDHRIIDGKEAVSFLVRLKDAIEDPQRLLLDI